MTIAGVRTRGGRRIAIAGPHGAELVADDMPLVGGLIAAGHKVLCLAPTISETDELTLAHAGADVEEIDILADKLALMPRRQVAKRIASVLSVWGADTVMAHGAEIITPVMLAAKKARIARAIAVQGRLPGDHDLGAENRRTPGWDNLIKAFDAASGVLCLNYDHAAQLELSGFLPEQLSPVVLPWSGVDLEAFAVSPLPPVGRGLTILMIAELARSRGVMTFCEAAQMVKEQAPQTTFLLAGPASRADDALSVGDLAPFRDAVEYLGDGASRAALISRCHVFAYPSFAETNPGPALEALAMGRPLIAADAAGCRELVDERVNGCLARPNDAASLAAAIRSYLKRPDLIPAMARASRQKAERRYDRRLVLAAMFDLLVLERGKVSGG
ncbi:MAG: glycosyltransferase [Alphaproteobacteria bacterium]|nr:glycosyltransferase [Alphaproteobacteria bacterium]